MRKRYIATAAVAAAAMAVGGVAVAQAPGPAEDAPDEALLEEVIAAFDDAGAPSTIATVRDGEETWSGAAGTREIDGEEDAEVTDHVRVASLTKSMVSTVALQLVDEGRLSLDDPVNDYLPYDDTITVEQLLNHTSGIPDYVNGIYPSLDEGSADDVATNRLDEYTPAELVELGTEEDLEFPPGEEFNYSNTNYIVLGMFIEDITGEDLAATLDTRVMEPAGMTSSYLPDTEPIPADPYTHPYFPTGEDEPPLDTSDLSPTQLWAGWGVISTPGDANAFFRAMFDGTLLPPELAEQAQQPTEQSQGEYGLGLQVDDVSLPEECEPAPDGVAVGHTGSGLGHTTLSFHSSDGDRQASLTYATDMLLEPNEEIGEAIYRFVAAGLCDSEPDPAPSDADLDRLLPDSTIRGL